MRRRGTAENLKRLGVSPSSGRSCRNNLLRTFDLGFVWRAFKFPHRLSMLSVRKRVEFAETPRILSICSDGVPPLRRYHRSRCRICAHTSASLAFHGVLLAYYIDSSTPNGRRLQCVHRLQCALLFRRLSLGSGASTIAPRFIACFIVRGISPESHFTPSHNAPQSSQVRRRL